MSQLIEIEVTCPHCGKIYKTKVFRTIWGENQVCRKQVMENNINNVTCPYCQFSFHAPLAMMYVDVNEKFAVWWEPYHDDGIDSDTEGYRKMFGEGNFYQTAPRIKDWEEFKNTIKKFYKGELVGNPITKMDINATTTHKPDIKRSGCLGLIALILVIGTTIGYSTL
jgi:endogenous inhibitor of DNA gyrase (YacG/DUF329 family)